MYSQQFKAFVLSFNPFECLIQIPCVCLLAACYMPPLYADVSFATDTIYASAKAAECELKLNERESYKSTPAQRI